jgi:primosomal protein N' (replication factor Y)
LSRHAQQPDIYVTTWIGTKDTIRPDVSMVGVMDADALTRRPDFRAAENSYRALVEMSEWAGPAGEGGRLVIQTSEPRHHALQALVRADYRFFLERELEQRGELSYPPFSELIRVEVSGVQADAAVTEVRALAERHGARCLGPIRIASGARQLLLKCRDAGPVAEDLRVILARATPERRLRVDVDPR